MAEQIPAIFIDRDGVLNIDKGTICHSDDFQFIEGVIESCRLLQNKGFALILITNQPGIAQGTLSEAQFLQLTEWMDWSLADKGVDLAGIYYCPHHPSTQNSENQSICDCHMPLSGMLEAAQHDLNINLAKSYLVTDNSEALQAANSAGIGTKILVRSGKPLTAEVERLADWIIDSLNELPVKIKK